LVTNNFFLIKLADFLSLVLDQDRISDRSGRYCYLFFQFSVIEVLVALEIHPYDVGFSLTT